MSEAIYYLLDKLVVVATIASLVMWGRLIYGSRGRQTSLLESIVPVRRQTRPFWTLADALVMFGSNLVLIVSLHKWMTNNGLLPTLGADPQPLPSTDTQLANVALVVTASLVSSIVTLAWLRMMNDRPIKRLGLVFRSRDAWIGLKASVMLLPPVLLISSLVSLLWPYQHEVLELLQNVDSLSVFFAMFFATAIVTPCFEEFLYRVLVQGGLQGMIDHDEVEGTPWQPRSYLPILITSVIFSLMHLGQGAAPIPLFFLSLGLGYLYRQTGNVTAPIVVHMVLNSMTMIAKFTETAGR